MYLLKFLQESRDRSAGINVEYRLACSGEFYNRKAVTHDWRKSDVSRVLLERPFPIFVASQPFDSYPQELCVRTTLNFVTETGGSPAMRGSLTFLPDSDVIDDLCAVLTLLSRRLVSVVTKTREKYDDDAHAARWYQSEVPTPIIYGSKIVAWRRRPATVITSATGQTVESNDPPPVGVDPEALAKFLIELSDIANAQEIIHAARLYKSALELIEDRPDTAYLTLVSVVESLASIAFSNFEPDEAEKLKSKAHVLKCARDFGLDDARAKSLVLEACKGERWLTRKFIKFCVEYCPVTELKKPDDVFLVLDNWNPPEADFENALNRIYRARSKNLHAASPFPPGVGIGMSPQVSVREMPLDLTERPEIPPVAWFERIVSIAARRFLIPKGPAPFIDAAIKERHSIRGFSHS
jgi:hypothetical protein